MQWPELCVGDGLGDDDGLRAGVDDGLGDGAGLGEDPGVRGSAELLGVCPPGLTCDPAAPLRREGCGSGAPARGADPCTWLWPGRLAAPAG
jgi:hypothetical protein